MSRSSSTATRASALLAVLLLGCCAASRTLRSRTTPEPADAHTHVWHETYQLATDGGQRHRVHQRTTIHTEYAIDHLGDPRVVHNAASQRLNVVRDETTMRDGKKVAIKDNSVNETTPSRLAAAPAYADVRETVVTHVGLEVGCTNDFEYEITTSAPEEERPLSFEAAVHLPHTVGKRTIQVVLPENQATRWQCLECEVEPQTSTDAGTQTLSFSWANLPAFDTGHARGLAPGQPRLVFSTHESWALLADELLERFHAAARPTDTIRKRALDLAEQLATAEQRIDALTRFVVDDIRTVEWPLVDLGFVPSAAADVLDRSYGHSLDKAVLLVALLASLDISARPVLVSRDTLFARNVPTLSQFSEVWLITDAGRWLSTTARLAGDAAAYVAGRSTLDLEAGVPFEVVAPIDAPVANQSRLVAEIEVGDDGKLTATMHVTLTGTYSPYYAGEKGSAALAETHVPSGWNVECEGCYARAHHLAPDLAAFEIRAEARASGADRVLELDLPWAPRSQILDTDVHRSTKATHTALRSLGVESVHLEIRTGDSLSATTELPSTFLANSVGRLISNHENREDGALVSETTLTIEKRVLDGEDYLSLRDLVTELHRAAGRSLLLLRKD